MTMRILCDRAGDSPAATLIAMLPGALQSPEELVEAGIVAAVRRRALPVDLALVDPGLRFIGEATDGSALQALDAQLMQPAQRQYRTIWLAGISIGGFMAMAYAERYPGRAAGLCLLAPYPGNRMLGGEIRAAGGVAGWNAGQPEGEETDGERRVWRWLAAPEPARAAAKPEMRLGYGAGDRFAAGQQLIAQTLPAGDVRTVAGGHDWAAWHALWEAFLDDKRDAFGRPAAEAEKNRGSAAGFVHNVEFSRSA